MKMNSTDLRNMSLEELVEFVKEGGKREVLSAWKEARKSGDDFMSDRLRYALCGGLNPERKEYHGFSSGEFLRYVSKYAEQAEQAKYSYSRSPERESFFAYA